MLAFVPINLSEVTKHEKSKDSIKIINGHIIFFIVYMFICFFFLQNCKDSIQMINGHIILVYTVFIFFLAIRNTSAQMHNYWSLTLGFVWQLETFYDKIPVIKYIMLNCVIHTAYIT